MEVSSKDTTFLRSILEESNFFAKGFRFKNEPTNWVYNPGDNPSAIEIQLKKLLSY